MWESQFIDQTIRKNERGTADVQDLKLTFYWMGLTVVWTLQKKKNISAFVNVAVETIQMEAPKEKTKK